MIISQNRSQHVCRADSTKASVRTFKQHPPHRPLGEYFTLPHFKKDSRLSLTVQGVTCQKEQLKEINISLLFITVNCRAVKQALQFGWQAVEGRARDFCHQ